MDLYFKRQRAQQRFSPVYRPMVVVNQLEKPAFRWNPGPWSRFSRLWPHLVSCQWL